MNTLASNAGKGTGAQALVRMLEAHGVTHIFGVPGAKIDSVFIALLNSSIQLITCRHEQNAAFMAAAMGRMTGRIGVCLATSGPGTTNLITGLITATTEGDPVLAIGGEVPVNARLKRTHQSLDAVTMMRPVTKYAQEVMSTDQLAEVLGNAIRAAESGRPGAAFIGLPQDIGLAQSCVDISRQFGRRLRYGCADEMEIALAASTLNASNKPILLLGEQTSRPEHAAALKAFIQSSGIPYVATFQGAGQWAQAPHLHRYGGRIGLFRNQPGDRLLDEADCVVTIGFDPVEYDPAIWNTQRTRPVIAIDQIAMDQDRALTPVAELIGDLSATLTRLGQQISMQIDAAFIDSVRTEAAEIATIRAQGAQLGGIPVHPLRVIHEITQVMTAETTVALDVGSHYIWMNRYLNTEFARQVLVSNGQQTLGVALPWAIAANLARPGTPVISVSGDGGFLFSAMELETAKRIGARFVHLVWDSQSYDMVSFQEAARYDGKTAGVKLGYYDIKTYAEAFGCKGIKIADAEELGPALREALQADVPVLIHIPIDYSDNLQLMQYVQQNLIH
ncbi:acetolactate synthase AlsS [Neisseriaceae bacterium TC5R-5]|nr:acetolactate synthase AlsS [Neisseriaceae bacterium TC5R-5]